MNIKFFFMMIALGVLIGACGTDKTTEATTDQTENVTDQSMTVIKLTKQMVTNTDGTVQENTVDVELAYNETDLKVDFKNDTNLSFSLKVDSIGKGPEGITIKVKDRKYNHVFIASGSKTQVTFNTVTGYGAMGFME